MSRIVTTEEFSTRRKIRGSGPNGGSSSIDFLRAKQYPLTSLSVNASLSPYKAYYDKDMDGNNCYYIDFNVGDFQFDEISIRTEGQHRLIVQGKSKNEEDETCREFTRDFTLPKNVDQYSIKAQLEETTRILSLIGQVEDSSSRLSSTTNSISNTANSSAVSSHTNLRSLMDTSISSEQSTTTLPSQVKLGSIKETKTNECIDYEIYLGSELKEGKVTLEMVGYSTLVVRVVNSDWDTNGDYNLELKRQIKLPIGVNSQLTQHGVDTNTAILLIKVPFK